MQLPSAPPLGRLALMVLLVALGGVLRTAANDLAHLTDEFDDPSSRDSWHSIWETEGWGANQLETWDVGTLEPGRMVMIPYASSWYQNWRGVLVYREVSGDFAVTTDLQPRNRSRTGAPGSPYSLAGLLVRRPRPEVISPATWTPGGENYIFLSLGAADQPGNYQFEVKTTVDSDSILEIQPGVPRARIQVVRLGSAMILLRQPEGGAWTVHRRYDRTDFPALLQVGLTTYTDWPSAEALPPLVHNQTVITNGQPDLHASFDYVRFARPNLPSALQGRTLVDPGEVSDAELLAFLGDAVNVPGGALSPAGLRVAGGGAITPMLLVEGLQPDRSYRLEMATAIEAWTTLTNWVSTGTEASWPLEAEGEGRFFRVVSP